jgi:membrane-associated phospholipid phosphatase
MPSMHVAWSFVAGVLFGLAWRSKRWAAILAVVHSSCMAAAVVLTANHYVLDVLAGLLVLGISIGLTKSSVPMIGWKRRGEARA